MKLKTTCVFLFAIFAPGFISGTVQADEKPFLDLSAQVTAGTDGVVKGVSETEGNGQFVIGLQAAHGPFYAGYRWKNVKSSDGADNQQQYTAGIKGKLGGFNLGGALWYKMNDGTLPGTDARFFEWQGDISRTFGATTLKFTEIYSPDSSGKTQEAFWHELGLSQKLSPKFSISGAVALREVKPKKNYMAYNLGVSYAIAPKTGVDLRFYDTNRHAYGKRYDERIVVAVTQKY